MPRGRNKALIARRDEMLCHRYHYWTETQRLRFDDTLKILSEEEFFLSEIGRASCRERVSSPV